jgi:hypothetical protein
MNTIPAIAALIISTAAPCISGEADTAKPTFSDFTVAEHFKGKPAPVNLSGDPKAKTYRTMLREGARRGPNFAGHFTIVIWGCGSSCQQFAIVDAVTGKVYFSREVPYVSFGDREGEPYGLDFREDSRLIAVYGRIKEDDPKGMFFFTWDGTKLTLIKSITGH